MLCTCMYAEDCTCRVPGFVQALEILEKPGKLLTLEIPGNLWRSPEICFIKPWKISQNFIEKNKFAKWCILLISLQVTIEIVDFRIISKLHFVLETTAWYGNDTLGAHCCFTGITFNY